MGNGIFRPAQGLTNGANGVQVPGEITPQEFKNVFRKHSAGVVVITAQVGEKRVGLTATSVISVSATPPLLAFSLAAGSSSWPELREAETVTLSFLAADQQHVAQRFAAKNIDRFAGGGWYGLPGGRIAISNAVAWVSGQILQRIAVGDSYLITVHAQDHGAPEGDRRSLVYQDRRYFSA